MSKPGAVADTFRGVTVATGTDPKSGKGRVTPGAQTVSQTVASPSTGPALTDKITSAEEGKRNYTRIKGSINLDALAEPDEEDGALKVTHETIPPAVRERVAGWLKKSQTNARALTQRFDTAEQAIEFGRLLRTVADLETLGVRFDQSTINDKRVPYVAEDGRYRVTFQGKARSLHKGPRKPRRRQDETQTEYDGRMATYEAEKAAYDAKNVD